MLEEELVKQNLEHVTKDDKKLFFDWAEKHGIDALCQASYYLFFKPDTIVGLNRLFDEISLPDSVDILEHWQDNNLTSTLLLRYYHAFRDELDSGSEIAKKYHLVARAQNNNQLLKVIKRFDQQTCFLALSYLPLKTNSEFLYEENLLRMWLYIHGLESLSQHEQYNKTIQRIISRLKTFSLTANDVYFENRFFNVLKKHLADTSLGFFACNNAIRDTTKELLLLSEVQSNKGHKSFVENIAALSLGGSELEQGIYENESTSNSKPTKTTSTLSSQKLKPLAKTFDSVLLRIKQLEPSQTLSLYDSDLENDDSDDCNNLLVVAPPLSSTEPESVIYSNSIAYQSAELSHYLPWSWDKVLPTEQGLLEQWIAALLQNSNKVHSLAGSLLSLSFQIGRSLNNILLLPISDTSESDWCLSKDCKTLHRLSIRRHSAKEPSKAMERWLVPLGEKIHLPLPEDVSRSLFSALSVNPDIKQLNQLRSFYSKEALPKWFNTNKPASLDRLSSGKFANAMGQKIFENTGDSHLARILSSSDKVALPAACGYGSWDIDTLEKGLPLTPRVVNKPKVNLIGSMLVVLENELKQSVASFSSQVKSSSTFIEFHNQLATYTVNALYAATGCRHLADPFDSIDQFYLADSKAKYVSRVYINDKSGDVHSGRLIPLSCSAVVILKHYLKHLQFLCSKLEVDSPSLAVRIKDSLTKQTKGIPLFFLLDNSLQWHSMNSKTIDKQVFEWPLPSNIFRHRFSQVMARLDVPNDVLEAWMGHGETGVSCYSDQSPRCRESDALFFSEKLEIAFTSLGFEEIAIPTELPLRNSEKPVLQPANRMFGEEVRQKNRQATIEAIQKQTLDAINAYMLDKSWEKLTQKEIDELVAITLTDQGSIAASYPSVRLNALLNLINEKELENEPVIKRIASLKPEQKLLSAESISALRFYPRLMQWAERCKKNLFSNALSKNLSSKIGTCVLAIEKQISDLEMLQAIEQGCHYRLIQLKNNQCYLEYGEYLDLDDWTAPIVRHHISYKVASWLHKGTSHRQKLLKLDDPSHQKNDGLGHASLEELADILGCDYKSYSQLVKKLCLLLDQLNLVVLPGILAADLSGRTSSTSPSFVDEHRIQSGKKLLAPINYEDSTDELLAAENFAALVPINTQHSKLTSDTLRKNAKQFKKEIYSLLKSYKKSQTKDLAKRIREHCKQSTYKVASAILATGYWIAEVIEKGKYKGRRETAAPLAPNTLLTYFSHLSSSFAGIAYDVDVYTLYEEEFIELYQQIIAYLKLKGSHTDYLITLLVSYHRYLINQGAPNIDWGELDYNSKSRHVSSGLMSEQDYQQCLDYIAKSYSDTHLASTMIFTLMLCFRFGLRAMEALGLKRNDWCTYGEDTWVLVRGNRFRSLKSDSGKRAVPLLFELEPIETNAIKQILGQYELLPRSNENHLLLSEVRNGVVQPYRFLHQLQSELIRIIKLVTGNNQLVLHHARHSFYNMLAVTLFDIETSLTQKLTKHLNKTKIKQVILGNQNYSNRRSSMALAVIMGHSNPSVGYRSYCRVITYWRESLAPINSQRSHVLEGARLPLSWEAYQMPSPEVGDESVFQAPTLHALTLLMRSVALGKTFEQAAAFLRLEPIHAEKIKQLFTTAIEKMTFKQSGEPDFNPNIQHFCSHIIEDGWARLLSASQKQVEYLPNSKVTLEELPLLIGENRQLLLAKDEHYELAKQLIQYYEIGDDQYRIGAYKESRFAKEKIELHKLKGVYDSRRLDRLTQAFSNGAYGRHQDYASLRLIDRSIGTLRTSYELTLASILLGYSSGQFTSSG